MNQKNRAVIAYRLKLAEYRHGKELIAYEFFSVTAAAEVTCDKATHSKNSNFEHDAAQSRLMSEIRAASRVRSAALSTLGPPPIMPNVLSIH